ERDRRRDRPAPAPAADDARPRLARLGRTERERRLVPPSGGAVAYPASGSASVARTQGASIAVFYRGDRGRRHGRRDAVGKPPNFRTGVLARSEEQQGVDGDCLAVADDQRVDLERLELVAERERERGDAADRLRGG